MGRSGVALWRGSQKYSSCLPAEGPVPAKLIGSTGLGRESHWVGGEGPGNGHHQSYLYCTLLGYNCLHSLSGSSSAQSDSVDTRGCIFPWPWGAVLLCPVLGLPVPLLDQWPQSSGSALG